MDIVMMHYHLNRGGVTQVLANHVRALAAAEVGPCRVLVVYGGRCEGWSEPPAGGSVELSTCVVPQLDYDDDQPADPSRLAGKIEAVLTDRGVDPQNAVLHVHNHALGKNVSLPGALEQLASAGWPLLLQIHDFAEDFRPENYRRLVTALAPETVDTLPDQLYPQAAHVHYATLNGRDHRLLAEVGVAAERLHLLPNPVIEPGVLPDKAAARARLAERFGVSPADRLLLYPVRGIRRKNIGEALLWSILSGEDSYVGLTLPPLNPREMPNYRHFADMARRLSLPCLFDMGHTGGLSYLENLAASDLILTTSVAEGFGLVFLESYLVGRQLVGRDLPDITADFAASGVQLRGLGAKLMVPVEWIGRRALAQSLTKAFRHALTLYDRPSPPDSELKAAVDRLIEDEYVDFARLDRSLQCAILEKASSKPACRDALLARNSWIEQSLRLSPAESAALVQNNAETIRRQYSLAECGRRLVGIYRAVCESPRDSSMQPPAKGHALLDNLLNLARLYPIRFEI